MKLCEWIGRVAACVVVAGMLVAATAASGRVVMFLKDGTSIGGELVEATPAAVTLRPSAKAPTVTKPWSAIRQLGNGLTRDAVVAEWRKTQADKLCVDCQGAAVANCTACGGKGIEPATAQPCAKCDGKGSAGKCRTPRCVDGRTPCPNPCLKPSDFVGPKDAEGKRWKSFRAKGGSARWSDGHIGELIVYEDGMPTNKGKCPRCEGSSVVVDPACEGSALQTCPSCKGVGLTGTDCAPCEAGKTPCATCNASGLKEPMPAK